MEVLDHAGVRQLVSKISDKFEKVIENTSNMVNVTYNELVALRSNSKLVPGQQYRITDYYTTTSQENTRATGHQFNIIVTADNKYTLNEEARAIQGYDGYFASSDLNAWKIWYCLDNDTTRFAWADTTNGKGVIYRMIDEWGNDCPYDFKNIQFRHPHDTYPDYYFTFTWIDDNHDIIDASVFGNNGTLTYYEEITGVRDNIIKPYIKSVLDEDTGDYIGTKQSLNNIVFISGAEYEEMGNDGFVGCFNNSFGNDCSNNSFGNACSKNSFGNACSNNSFGNHCYNNSFGNNCYSNHFGYSCYYNSFGNACSNNSFGNNCCYNSFGVDCYYNSFRMSNSVSADLRDYCLYNHFDDGCCYNIIWNADTASASYKIQHININRGTRGVINRRNMIPVSTNATFEINPNNVMHTVSGQGERYISIKNDYGECWLDIATFRGVWDHTNNKWLICAGPDNGTVGSTDSGHVWINAGTKMGNTGIGYNRGTALGYKLSVNGDVGINGNCYESSDETLKDFHGDIEVDLDKLKSIPKKLFTWKDSDDKGMHIGTSAQKVQELYPEIVHSDDDGKLSVDYAKLSIVALKAVDSLVDKNKELEGRVNKLEDLINKLIN